VSGGLRPCQDPARTCRIPPGQPPAVSTARPCGSTTAAALVLQCCKEQEAVRGVLPAGCQLAGESKACSPTYRTCLRYPDEQQTEEYCTSLHRRSQARARPAARGRALGVEQQAIGLRLKRPDLNLYATVIGMGADSADSSLMESTHDPRWRLCARTAATYALPQQPRNTACRCSPRLMSAVLQGTQR